MRLHFFPSLIVAALIAPLMAFTTLPGDDDDDERVLSEIEVNREPIKPDDPVTGTLLVRPLLLAHNRRHISIIDSVELVFAPVEVRKDGVSVLNNDQRRKRFRITTRLPQRENPTRIAMSLNRYKTEVVELPGGTYVLSEVHYNVLRLESRQDGLPSSSDYIRERVSYCLSEGTLAFEIHNGETGFLGQLVIADIHSNPARWREHHPIELLDTSLSGINGRYSRNDSVVNLDVDALAFDPESGLCPHKSRQVAGWKSSETQQ